MKKPLWIVLFVLSSSVSALAQEVKCPKDYTEVDSSALDRLYEALGTLQSKDDAVAATELFAMLKTSAFTNDILNEVVNSLGHANARGRIGVQFDRVVASRDLLLLTALDNPCAGRFAYAAAAGVIRVYANNELTATVADEILQRFLNHPTMVADYTLREAVNYIPFSRSTDAEKLAYYKLLFSSPAAGARTLSEIARRVVIVAPNPGEWLAKIIRSPVANSYTALGVGYGIGNSPVLPSNSSDLLNEILTFSKAQDEYFDERYILEAVTAAVGRSQVAIPGEAAFLARMHEQFSNWAIAPANRGLLSGGYVGKAMHNLSVSHRKIGGLADTDSVLGALVTDTENMDGFLDGLIVQVMRGQLNTAEFESVLHAIIPSLTKQNIPLVQDAMKAVGYIPSSLIQKAIESRVTLVGSEK